MDSGTVEAGLDAATADASARPVDAGGPTRFFEDVTASSGIDFDHRPWPVDLPERFAGGVCAIDVDGAPPLDLFFALTHGFEGDSRLYLADGALHFHDATREAGLLGVRAVGCLAFDVDADGDDDLLVTGLGGPRLFENVAGRFVERAERLVFDADPLDFFAGASAGDVDGDGDLDLLVAGYAFVDPNVCADAAPPDWSICRSGVFGYPFIADLLLIQGPDGVFRDQAASLAPDLLRSEPALVVAIADLDHDRRPELFVANDLGVAFPNRALVRDASGQFSDRAWALGVDWTADEQGVDAMAFSMADLDQDGELDFVITGFEHQPTAVYLCGATGPCEDSSSAMGTPARRESFRYGAALLDVNLDGRPDLIEATGHYFTDAELASGARATEGLHGPQAQPANLYLGTPDGRLSLPELAPGDALLTPRVSRGLSVIDLDDDGRPDVVFAPGSGSPAVLHNIAEPVGEPLVITLRGRPPNTEAALAHVEVRVAGSLLVRDRLVGEGYLGNFDRRLFFGVPRGSRAEVRVRWPDGRVTTRSGVAAGSRLELREP